MTAVAASYVAVAAVYGSAVAVDAVKANETAWATLTGATSAVMGKAVAVLSGLNPDSYADMTAVAASSTAMTAVAASTTALSACRASTTAMNALAASSTALTALAASSLVTKYNPTSGNAWTTGTVNGSGIFIKVISYQANNNTVTIDSGSAQSISNNTNYAKAFQSKLAVYYVPYSVSGYGIYYIPC